MRGLVGCPKNGPQSNIRSFKARVASGTRPVFGGRFVRYHPAIPTTTFTKPR